MRPITFQRGNAKAVRVTRAAVGVAINQNARCETDTIRGTRFLLNKTRALYSYALFRGRSRVKTLQIA